MLDNFEILILCGGEGARLRSVVSDVPKPMAPINGKPFLDYLVRKIIKQGFNNLCFLSGYKSEFITSYFEENFKNAQIRFSIEETALGTGGAIFQAMENSKYEKFIILNGDTFFNIDLCDFIKNWKNGTFKIALKSVDNSDRYGRVETDKSGRITSLIEKGVTTTTSNSLINGGIYILDKSLLQYGKGLKQFVSLENDVFPRLILEEKLYSQMFNADFIDIGIPEDYTKAKDVIEAWSRS